MSMYQISGAKRVTTVPPRKHTESGEDIDKHQTQQETHDVGFCQKSDRLPRCKGVVKAKANKPPKLHLNAHLICSCRSMQTHVRNLEQERANNARGKPNSQISIAMHISYAHAKRCNPVGMTSNRGKQTMRAKTQSTNANADARRKERRPMMMQCRVS